LERRRRRAVALLAEGLAPVEVARRVGVDRRSVRRWRAAYRHAGDAGLRAQPIPGRPPKLTPPHRTQLEALLLKGARAAGFPTELWTCPRVAAIIQRRFGVRYHVDHLGRLLRALGWSPQKPTRRAQERDDRAIQRWVKTHWPQVKKTPPAAERRSSSSMKQGS
jgi:transposase